MKTFNTILLMTFLLSFLSGCGGGTAAVPKEWQKAKRISGQAGLDHPRALAADDRFIYFVTGGTVAGKQAGTNNLMKMPVDGGEATVLFKGGDTILTDNAIALDDTYVYFNADGLRRVPKSGGEAATLTGPVSVWDIALDNKNIYWRPYVGEGMAPQPMYSVPKTGGEPRALTDARQSDGLAVDDNFLYWIQTDGIYKAAKSGGAIEKIHSSPSGETPIGLKMDENSFYYLSGPSIRNLMQLPKNGGSAKQLAASVSMFWLGDSEVVYLRNTGVSERAIFKTAKTGGSETELDRGGFAADLVVWKTKIFLSDIDKISMLEK